MIEPAEEPLFALASVSFYKLCLRWVTLTHLPSTLFKSCVAIDFEQMPLS